MRKLSTYIMIFLSSLAITSCADGRITTDAPGNEHDAIPSVAAALPENGPAEPLEITSRSPLGNIDVELYGSQTVSIKVNHTDTFTLVYSATSENSDIATVEGRTGGSFLITAVGVGETSIRLTATDSNSQSDSIEVLVRVFYAGVPENNPPVFNAVLPGNDILMDLSSEFTVRTSFEDESPSSLTFSAFSSDDSVAVAGVGENGQFTVSSVGYGQATITLSVTDSEGLYATIPISVYVDTCEAASE